MGFSDPTGAQPILAAFQKSFTAAAKNLNITVETLDAQLDPNKQISDVNQLVAQHVDAIVVFPISQNSLTPALNRARQAGIKVLGFNAILKPTAGNISPYDANFDQGQTYQGAQLLANYVGTQLDCKGNVLGITIGEPVPSLHFMVQQYQSYLTKKCPAINWVGTTSNATDDIAGGQTTATDALTKNHGDIQAVMAYNDDSAIGASVAFKNAGIKNPVLVGQNGDPEGVEAIKDGRMSAMIDLVPWREALVGITMVKRLLDGQPVPKWVATPIEMYTKATIDKHLEWSKAVSEITAGTLTCANGGCPSALTH